MQLVESIWEHDGAAARVARAALAPFEGVYKGIVALRGAMYDRGLLPVEKSAIPSVSVGNLTVGGTGKTPVSAWMAARLAAMGLTPAIVLRRYGDDEPRVHEILNPGVPVVVGTDRAGAVRDAILRGADVVVFDDAFQHRRAFRNADVVLISADRWTRSPRMLPAGPWREPLSAIRRASIVVVTRKVAGTALVDEVAAAVREVSPDTPLAVVRLSPSLLVPAFVPGSAVQPTTLQGRKVVAIAAIGDPASFFRQIEELGAVVERHAFPDHHAFSPHDVARILAFRHSADFFVCTLKDAVKLAVLWPDDAPLLWYVSLSVEVESGQAAIDELLSGLPRPCQS